MSKRVDATITCPKCGKQYPGKLYRTIWGEYEENRNLVMNDEINVMRCPHCGFSFKASYPFMYVDIKANFAVWWEPQHDPGIDSDTQGFARMFGERSFYATAPRVQDWEEFKRTIHRYYSGELVGGPVEKMKFGIGSSKKSGCLGILLIALVLLSASIISCYGRNEKLNQNSELIVENLDSVSLNDSIVKEILLTPGYMSQLLESANNGNANAQYVLATCYYNGWEMAQDYNKAASWYEKAAEQGHAKSQSSLGECYMQGLGVPIDENKAINLFESSASQGCPEGIGNLGQAYFLGAGVEKDIDKAIEMMHEATQQGVNVYFGLLGRAYYQLGDYSKAFKNFQIAAEQGDGEAQRMLGDFYFYGIGIKADKTLAEKWYSKAVEHGVDVNTTDVTLGNLSDERKYANIYDSKYKPSQIHYSNKGELYEIKCKVNNNAANMILKPRSSEITISQKMASSMFKNGSLKREDVIEPKNYTDANESIKDCTIIKLKDIRLGDISLRYVKAKVVKAQAYDIIMGLGILEELGV